MTNLNKNQLPLNDSNAGIIAEKGRFVKFIFYSID